jgi:hypothetical protein
MSIVLDLPQELESALATEATQLGSLNLSQFVARKNWALSQTACFLSNPG